MADDQGEQAPLINIDKLEKLISLYKFPLILSLIGLILFSLALTLLIKNQSNQAEIEFITEATSSAKIKVDIAGAVIKPGLYELEEGSRIQDALISAGGLSADADRNWLSKNLNRAAKLIDGGKIYIPSLGEASLVQTKSLELGTTNTQTGNLLGITSDKININTASRGELESLTGVGPVTAQKIIDGRPYNSVSELRERKILGQSLYGKIKDLLIVY